MMNSRSKRMEAMNRAGAVPIHKILCVLSALLILSACAGIPISYYDGTTYTHLTELKAETMLVVESFDTKPVVENEAKIEALTLKLRKAYEYERGKGDPNRDTTQQFEKILELINSDIKTYRDNGPQVLGRKFFSEAARVVGQAFDIAIATENAKNKDKR